MTRDDLKLVVDMELSKVRGRLADRCLALELTDEAKAFVIKKSKNLEFGARPLRRKIEQYIEDPLAEELLRGEFQGKDAILVDVEKDDDGKIRHLVFEGKVSEKVKEEPPVGAAADRSPTPRA